MFKASVNGIQKEITQSLFGFLFIITVWKWISFPGQVNLCIFCHIIQTMDNQSLLVLGLTGKLKVCIQQAILVHSFLYEKCEINEQDKKVLLMKAEFFKEQHL